MRLKVWFGVILLIFLIILTLLVIGIVRGELGRPVRYELPAGYKGWVLIEYQNPACHSLEVKGIYLVIPIPHSGRTCTSSPAPQGWRYERYEYVTPNGKRTTIPFHPLFGENQIWASSYAPAQETVRFPRERFFVGTRDELERSWSDQPDIRDRK